MDWKPRWRGCISWGLRRRGVSDRWRGSFRGLTIAWMPSRARSPVRTRQHMPLPQPLHESHTDKSRNVIPDIDLPKEGVGGIVIGGDFQGLGIARSLGRRGAPVCVIDDEPSIARLSRYTTHSVRVK